MVQIIEEQPGFLDRIGFGIAGGAKAGAELLPHFQKMAHEEKKQQFLNQLLGGGQGQQQPKLGQQLAGSQQQGPSSVGGGFNAANLSESDIAAATIIDPVLGRNLMHMKDVSLREARQQKEMSPEYQREKEITGAQAKSDIKFNEELQSAKKLQHIKTQTLENLERLNKKGVTGKPYEKALEKFGLVSQTSEGRREFAAEVKNLITDIRSILGGQFSNFEFQTILNAYPSADFSKEANDAILKNLKYFQDIRNQEFKIAEQIKKENNGKIPSDFQSSVNERLDKYVLSRMQDIKSNTEKIVREKYNVPLGHTLLIDPTDGEMLAVPDDQVNALLLEGAYYP